MKVITIRDRNTLTNVSFQKFLEEALGSVNIVAPGGLADAAGEILTYIDRLDHYLLVGIEDGAFTTLCLGSLPQSRLFPKPHITFFYNVGSKDVKNAVLNRMMDIFLAAGYSSIWAMNASERPDRAWEKVLDTGQNVFKRIGSLYEIGAK